MIEVHFTAADAAEALREDVRVGLTAEPKWLPPKWFYDARGSRLFEQITMLPEYYPTRAELPVEHPKHVAVELRGHPCRIVVSRHQHPGILHQVCAEQQQLTGVEHLAQPTEELGPLVRQQVADGAAEEGDRSAGTISFPVGQQLQVPGEVGHHTVHQKSRIVRGDHGPGLGQR